MCSSDLLAEPETFATVRGRVEDTGEGRWTVAEAVDRAVALPVITAALFARFSSRQPDSFAARLVAALRNQFGGHHFLTEAAAAEASKRAAGPGEGTAGPETPATGHE